MTAQPIDAAIVGAGHAGLAVSHCLAAAGVEHVVLERGRVGESWRGRWESFCLVTPNWTVRLPGGGYDGEDPDGYMPRDALVAFLERYAGGIAAPVREGVAVHALAPAEGGFALATSDGPLAARAVVVASGTYARAHRPAAAAALPAALPQLGVADYSDPGALPPGGVLVIGSGQSGCQIAEELRLAGRDVWLACGRAPWADRRIGGRDLLWWLEQSGFLDAPYGSLPGPEARLFANVLSSGAAGGHDLHLRTLHALGVRLVGHLAGADGTHARFASDLSASIAWGDERNAQLRKLFRDLAAARGLSEPDLPDPAPLLVDAPERLPLDALGAVIVAAGFRPAYADWIHVPGAFDAGGFPLQADGTSAVAPGLHFAGVHFQRKRKSSLMLGAGEDAAIVADRIAAGR